MSTTEERLIRPYPGVDDVQRLVGSVRLLFGGDVLEPGDHLTVPVHEFIARPIRIRIARDEEGAEVWRAAVVAGSASLDLPAAQLELLVLVSTPRLKLSEVACRHRLAPAGLPHELTIAAGEARPVPLRAPSGGAEVTFLVCLAEQGPRRPLRPWRKGTWLGKAEFGLRSFGGEYGFQPIALSADSKATLGLEPTTSRFVRLTDPRLLTNPDAGEEIVELFVDEDLLAQLSHDPSSSWSRAIQTQLFVDTLTVITHEAAGLAERPRTVAEIDGSLLSRVVDMAAGGGEVGNARRNSLLRLLLDDPTRFVSLVEARTDQLSDMLTALRSHST